LAKIRQSQTNDRFVVARTETHLAKEIPLVVGILGLIKVEILDHGLIKVEILDHTDPETLREKGILVDPKTLG
jgi:hypothetical protein